MADQRISSASEISIAQQNLERGESIIITNSSELLRAPDSISRPIWYGLDSSLQDELLVSHKKIYPPKGVDEKLWQVLDDRAKQKMIEVCHGYVKEDTHLITSNCYKHSDIKSSNIYTFFFDFHSEIDFDVCKYYFNFLDFLFQLT